MFDRIFEWLDELIQFFVFWVIIDEYERGVVKTLGVRRPRQHRWQFWMRKSVKLGPGLWLVWPLGIDEVLVDNVVPTVDEFDEQSLTTKDGKNVVLTAVVTWSIEDVEKILFEVEDSDEALEESTCGIIGDEVAESTWADIHKNGFAERVTKQVRKRAKKWGIKIHTVQFKNLSLSRSIRLLGM
jgi:regulator of protease activity HflC (stomatin/prohibitin superfamily)